MDWFRHIDLPWGGALEIAVLAFAYYYILLFFRGTRGAQVLTGFIIFLLALVFLTSFFHLETLSWILQRVMVYLALCVIIIFQPEIRRALAEIGKQHVFSAARDNRGTVDDILKAVLILSERKIGALIAVEREIGTRAIEGTGVRLDAALTPELLAGLFYPHTPLHDGGVIIRSDRISAAGCLFPLSHNEDLSKTYGMRHRAAIGITEETDCVVVVVSEETGNVSVAYRGRLIRGLDEEHLRRVLAGILLRGRSQGKNSVAAAVRESLDLSPQAVARTEEERTGEM